MNNDAETQPPVPPASDPDRSSAREPDAPRPRLRTRARAAENVLREVSRAVHRALGGRGKPLPKTIELSLHLQPEAGDGTEIFDQIAGAIREHAAGLEGFRRGRIYCYWCGRSDCEHAFPPRPTAVFSGYSSTGIPLWHDFVQTLIDAGDERVDRLFARPRRPIALVQSGRELKRELLHAFGRSSKTYDVLGQVVAGYFNAGRRYEPGREHEQDYAVTLQIVESRTRRGRFRLDINVVRTLPDPAADGPGADRDPALAAALRYAEGRVKEIERKVLEASGSEARTRILGEIPKILRRTAAILDRTDRQSRRRTRHRDERGESRAQVHKAHEDLLAARPGEIFYDEYRRTLIVLGDRHRVHAFAPDGRHVTTFTMQRESIDRRLRTRRWRPALGEEIRRLRGNDGRDASPGGEDPPKSSPGKDLSAGPG